MGLNYLKEKLPVNWHTRHTKTNKQGNLLLHLILWGKWPAAQDYFSARFLM